MTVEYCVRTAVLASQLGALSADDCSEPGSQQQYSNMSGCRPIRSGIVVSLGTDALPAKYKICGPPGQSSAESSFGACTAIRRVDKRRRRFCQAADIASGSPQ